MTVDLYYLIKEVGVPFPMPELMELAVFSSDSTVFLGVDTLIETEFEPVPVMYPIKITVGSDTGIVGWNAISAMFEGMCAIPYAGGMNAEGFFAYPESGISGSVKFYDPAQTNIPGTSDYPMQVILTPDGPIMVTVNPISESEYRMAILDFEGNTHTSTIMDPFYQPIHHNDGGLIFFSFGAGGITLKKTKLL